METTTLAIHTLDAIATAIHFLFQIAALEASISARLGKTFLDTYIRITIKSEAAKRLKYPNS
jgi:hypothetical protein